MKVFANFHFNVVISLKHGASNVGRDEDQVLPAASGLIGQ